MTAFNVLSLAAITAMFFAVSAHAGHVNVPARANAPKVNVPKGNPGTYTKPGTGLGHGAVNGIFKKPGYPSALTQVQIGRVPTSLPAAAHTGPARQPNVQVNVPKARMPNPPPPTGIVRGSSGHARLLGLAVAPASSNRPHLRPFIRIPSAPVVR